MQTVNVKECIDALKHHGAAIVTFECFENAKTAPKGRIAPPTADSKKIGLHAVALFDHDPESQCFYFRNSWGPEWGNRGYGELPYDFIERGHVIKLTVLG